MPDDVGGALTGQGYNTELPLADEFEFRQWLKDNRVPFDPEAKTSDYDMRGYWQGLRQESPHARPTEVNPNDNETSLHGLLQDAHSRILLLRIPLGGTGHAEVESTGSVGRSEGEDRVR